MRNINKLIIMCLVFCVLCSFAGCNENQKPVDTTITSSSDFMDLLQSNNTNEDKQDDNFVDLTTLSSTMVYAEVYNIMCNPDDYTGKTIKMTGQFSAVPSADQSKYYYACLISDAMACCQQGIEFVLEDESIAYPDDYPKEGEDVTVTGQFELYTEDGASYCHLINAVMA